MQDLAPASGDKVILPRHLRRAVRFLGSLATGRIDIPRHLGTASLVAFYAVAGGYSISLSGETRDVTQALTSAVGFAINNVKVSGNAETSEIDILERLGLDGTTSLMALNVVDTRTALKTLPWVQDAEVRKIYPDTIEIKLTERKAFGIWQHGAELSLIEKSGSVIAPLRDNKFAYLPLFVGRDAESGAEEIMADFDQWPDVKKQVKAFMRVAGRRWDLQLANGVIVKLPEHNMARAMADLAKLNSEHQLVERDIVAVDLRLEDRVTVQLTADATKRRTDAVVARAKALKKAGEAI
ncbi:cell division protein FtsQ/DivIB [Rhizobium sp. KVB221]|uniref:Cell division protein FtsQ n=1 Tax=Rhizobium setariae TaxID=2801340 RepID=A0A937CP38_9HYPH|nr:cell division protein FtsQ/DivIB [Rhizobium setariae]MBL0374466.1 cell division protein FtsQ/DivIB [Rhizobium setariae]